MNSKFVAIPVGQGDSFYYKGPSTSVLVDGGRSAGTIAQQFRTILSTSELDVLICTHNDADHAIGVLGILESGIIQCREVWLPGKWTARLKDLLANPYEFFQEIHKDWHEDHLRIEEVGTLAEYGDKLSMESRLSDETENRIESIEDGNRTITDALENAGAYYGLYISSYGYKLGTQTRIPYSPKGLGILFDAIEAADRIRRIALAAFHAGAKIRWFEYGSTQPLTHSVITPLNCQEVGITQRVLPRALNFIALSKANRESLVFSVPPTDESPGVVFSADSDFGFALNIPSSLHYLVTAPHHGSESNAKAYTNLGEILKSGILVRSDGNYPSRPGKSFLKHPSNKRFCTLCRRANRPKQIVEFNGDAAGWHAIPAMRSCACV